MSLWFLTWPVAARQTAQPGLDLAQINQAASNSTSLLLDATERVRAVSTFLKLVQIKGPSGQEQAIREETRRTLKESGATEIRITGGGPTAPLNLAMEIPATGALTNRPGILLNAHLDTISQSTPEHLAFAPSTRDFFHKEEKEPARNSSFGGDDRSGVAVVAEAVRVLEKNYWSRGIPHRRIVLLLTADEERGCVGAKYLGRHHPQLFENLEASLTIDGPLDLRSKYPQQRLVAVVAENESTILPYKRLLGLMEEFSTRTRLGFGRTEIGLGMGDFAHFPSSARAGLHLRSPVRGWHTRERVNVQDLINHVDLVCSLLLGLDHSLPAKISPEALARPGSVAHP